MAEFIMEIAGCAGKVCSLFDSTKDYCRNYLTDRAPDFSVTVTREDLIFEQRELDEEARQEGMKRRKFSDPFLERAAVQRAFAEELLLRNGLMVHGSCVALDGKGYLFTAKCGTGKSTHTRLWRETFGDRAVMVNDDKPFLLLQGERAMVCGAPWSGKHGLDTNVTVPLQGICILRRGQEDRIRRLSGEEGMDFIRQQLYCPMDPEKASVFAALADRLGKTVPLWLMTCTREPRAAMVSMGAMSTEEM